MRFGALAAVCLAACKGGTATVATFAGMSKITLHGKAFFADGGAASHVTINFNLLASGESLFPAGVNGCSPGDDHAQALQVVKVSTMMDGAFTLNVPMTGFVRATDETCAMSQEAASRLTLVDVFAQADADFSSCLAYCRRFRTETCYSDCASRGQKFVWADSVAPSDVGAPRTIQFETLGPPLAGTPSDDPPLPDLQVNGAAAQSSVRITQEDFTPTACVVADGCIGAPGSRTLLRFDGDLMNLGAGELQIGSPYNNPLFTYSACHKHYHLNNIMTFELLDPAGEPVIGDQGRVVVRKQGFCIQGIMQVAGDAPNAWDCDNQGLSPGWEDIYDSELNCQWLDVTGVPGGEYSLKITVNASRIFPESDFDNNSALIPVSIP